MIRLTLPPSKKHHVLDFEGWAQTLITSHLLWDTVPEFQISAEYLKRFKVVILPDAACISKEQAEAITQYVKAGGTLISTEETSMFDEDGHQQDNFQLADVFGVDFVKEREPEHAFLKVNDSIIGDDEPWVTEYLTLGDGQLTVKTREGAEVLGEIYDKTIFMIVNVKFPTEHPSLVLNKFGKGSSYYFAGAVGLHYRQNGQGNIRKAMEKVLKSAIDKDSPVTLEGSPSLELFAHTQEGQNHLVVNLVNYFQGVTRSAGMPGYLDKYSKKDPMRFEEIEEYPKISEATLVLRELEGKEIKNVYLAPDKTKLKMTRENGEVKVVLRDIGVHTMVVAEY